VAAVSGAAAAAAAAAAGAAARLDGVSLSTMPKASEMLAGVSPPAAS